MKEHEEAMKTYEQGLTFEKDNWELKEGLMKCQQAINKVKFGCTIVMQPLHHILVCILFNLLMLCNIAALRYFCILAQHCLSRLECSQQFTLFVVPLKAVIKQQRTSHSVARFQQLLAKRPRAWPVVQSHTCNCS